MSQAYNSQDVQAMVSEQIRAAGLPVPSEMGAAAGNSPFGPNSFMGGQAYTAGRYAGGNRDFFRAVNNYDGTTQAVARFAANASYREDQRGSEAYRQSVRNISQFAGAAINSQYIAGPSGIGSAYDLAFGIQNVAVGSGIRVNGQKVFGGGATTDAAALEIYKSVDKNFFSGPLGLGNAKTHGFDKTEVGQVFGLMQQRGAFNNAVDATLSAGPDGGMNMALTADSGNKINLKMQEALKTLGMMKDIFGATKNAAQLFNIAENLGGTDFQSDSSMQAMRKHLMTSTTRAMAIGMDPRGVLEYEARTSEVLRGMGYSKTAAGMSTGFITGNALDQWSTYDQARGVGMKNNVYMPKMDIAAFIGNSASLNHQLAQHSESSPMLLALSLMQSGSLTEAQNKSLKTALADTSEDGIQNVRQTLEGMGVTNINSSVNLRGGNQGIYNSLSPEGHAAFDRYSNGVLGRRSQNDLIRSMFRQDGLEQYGESVSGNQEMAISSLQSVVSNLTRDNQVSLAGMLTSGKTEGISELLRGDLSNMSEGSRNELMKNIGTLGSGFGRMLNNYQSLSASNPGYGASTGDMNARAMRAIETAGLWSNTTKKPGGLVGFLNGLGGGEKSMSSGAVMEYLGLTDPKSIMSVTTASTAEQINAAFEGSVDQTTINSWNGSQDKEALLARMALEASQSGAGVMRNAEDKKSGFNVANVKDMQRVINGSLMQKAQRAELIDKIGGKGTAQDLTDYNQYINGKGTFTKDRETRLEELYGEKAQVKAVTDAALSDDKVSRNLKLDLAFEKDSKGTTASLAAALSERNATMLENVGKTDPTSKKKYADAERDSVKIKEAMSRGQGSFLGKLILKMDEGLLLNLFDNGKGKIALDQAREPR